MGKASKKAKDTPTGEILNRLKAAMDEELAHATLAIRRLPSGDIVLQMGKEEAKQKLAQNTQWLEQAIQGAKLHNRTYSVIMHGIKKKAINANN